MYNHIPTNPKVAGSSPAGRASFVQMKLEYYSVEKLKKEILAILSKYLDLSQYKIFFFGSRVKNKSTPTSDIDIGIIGPPIAPSAWAQIEEEIENLPTLYKIDLVDFNWVSREFKEEALKNIELIHG